MQPDSYDHHHGRAMGGELYIVTVGGSRGLADAAAQQVADLERRWTRFNPTSELSRMNANAGTPTFVSRATAYLVERAVVAYEASGGAFDPTLLDAIVALGYDTDLPVVQARCSTVHRSRVSAGCEGIDVDVKTGYVFLPLGVGIDPGGIGKGLAADLAANALVAGGAAGALVNLGGDLRIVGQTPPGGWRVGVEDPHHPAGCLAVLSLSGGGVATSSVRKRRWSTTRGEMHHLLDPATSWPVTATFDTITVVADEAWWAEALTKALMVTSPDRWDLLLTAESVIAVAPDGTVMRAGAFRPEMTSPALDDRVKVAA